MVQLTWTNNAISPVSITVSQQENLQGWVNIATLDPSSTSYQVFGLDDTDAYQFRVRANFNDGSFTPWSNVVVGSPIQSTITTAQTNAVARLNPAEDEMPIGNIMEYAYGRVWVTDQYNNTYASDIMFGDGFTTTSNCQNFTEQTYWQTGGSFTPPVNLGPVTGSKIMPYIGSNVRGQGELVMFCEQGAYTLDGSIDRTQWTTTSIQRVALLGRGCMGPYSIIDCNGEVFFRSNDGWSMFNNSQVEFVTRLSYRKLTKEVNRWVGTSDNWMSQFATGMFFDNRLILAVAPYLVANTDPTQGAHRPHKAMVALDLDQPSQTSPDASTTFRWDGLWTGIRPLQMLTASIRNKIRGFIFSHDDDGINRLYELTTNQGDDVCDGVSSPIKSYFITKRYNYDISQQTNRYQNKSLCGGDIWLSNINEQSQINVSYRVDSYPIWNTLMGPITIGCPNPDDTGCEYTQTNPRWKKLEFPTPAEMPKEGGSGMCAIGAEHQLLVEMTGTVTVDRIRLSALTQGNVEDPTGDLPSEPFNCDPVDYCPVNDYDYYLIVNPQINLQSPQQ